MLFDIREHVLLVQRGENPDGEKGDFFFGAKY